MMKACKCGSYAINHNCHGRDGSDDDLCDVCYWRKRAEQPAPVQGWKLVPIEPTEYMWKAVNKLDDEMAAGSYDGKGCSIEQAWNCLLAAAPQPAQRTWVGLTDVEWMNIVNKDQAWFGQRPDEVAHEVAKLVEAKLKEKNT